MKVVGIIAEYNPFHNGHKYQIEELKKQTGADFCIIAMSGNFLQRGVPAICDKYTRTRMALSCGADLVLELPSIWATASAEYFAQGGVNLLNNTGVVTHLGFGAETDDLHILRSISSIFIDEPPIYKRVLSSEQKKGLSFPIARKNALLATIESLPQSLFSEKQLDDILNTPNNILALEYLKALPENITPVLIQRKGAGYHDTSLSTSFSSATAIRSALFDINSEPSIGKYSVAIPEDAYAIFHECVQKNAYMSEDDLSDILGYCLLSLSKEGYEAFADCNLEISNRITNLLNSYTSYTSFCQLLKSKDITYTRISRLLLHILLDIRQEDYSLGKKLGYAPYLRMLGFRKDATELLSQIKKEASVPIITKVADAASILSSEAYLMFKKDLYASSVYNQVMTVRKHQPTTNDYTNPIVIL